MSETAKEDILPVDYKYAWNPKSDLTLDDFLTKYKPSMIQNDGTKPWIWMSKQVKESDDLEKAGTMLALGEATQYLSEITEKVEGIKDDPSIPTRSNKKTGTRSKKEVREELQAEAAEKLRDIAIKHNYLTGKWLIFSSSDRVDAVWSSICKSLESGSLKDTAAYTAKVATLPQVEQPHYQHVICLYLPNIYNKNEVTEVMKVLLRNHGLNLSGCKSDMNTLIGLDSKHPSGVPSTVWKNTALLPESEIKRLKDAYWEEVETSKKAKLESNKEAAGTFKVKLQAKKQESGDPFGSDDEEDAQTLQNTAEKSSKAPATKKAEQKGESDRSMPKSDNKGTKRKTDSADDGKALLKKKKVTKKVF